MIFGFDLALNWHLLEYVLALYWICYSMFSVVIVRGIIARITCLKFSLLSFSEIQRLFEDREICVFFRRLQRHNTTTSFFNTLTFTHTLTHMTGQQWLIGQVVPDFFGFCKFFGPHVVSKNFLDRQGVTQHTKILSSES